MLIYYFESQEFVLQYNYLKHQNNNYRHAKKILLKLKQILLLN